MDRVIKKLITAALCFIALFTLTGCFNRVGGLAPIEELKWRPFSAHQQAYQVRRGDTLYAIAFRYDKDYRDLARANRLSYPYHLRVGQTIRLSGARRSYSFYKNDVKPVYRRQQAAPVRRFLPTFRKSYPVAYQGSGGQWYWPVNGRLVTGFSPSQGKKGINLAGRQGDVIRASADGVVAYAGNGLSGYGNLIIIKHNREFLTAYGNNSRNLVREGQRVRKGQAIAYIGMIDRKYWGCHFEIRRGGQPVNPLNYLKKK